MAFTVSVFAILTSVGFAIWIVGSIFEYTGIAVIGGALVIATGAMVVENGGLDHRTGEFVDQHTAGEETVSYTYEKVEQPTNFQLGLITVLFGGVMIVRRINEESS